MADWLAAGHHLVLVGLMGVGKSTVGRALAARLGRPFVDTDEMIEDRRGRTVREIFATDGEQVFRALETEVLLDALDGRSPSVIAAAGGAVLSPANRVALAAAPARVVWLLAEPRLLVERITTAGHRPLLDDDPAATLSKVAVDREALYREVADAIIAVDGLSVEEVVESILR